jgi:hypothetical protein
MGPCATFGSLKDWSSELPVRRFPPPWTVEEKEACFVVRDHHGQQLAYVYFEDEPGCRSAAKLLTRDEARRIAANIAKLPDLLKRPQPRASAPEGARRNTKRVHLLLPDHDFRRLNDSRHLVSHLDAEFFNTLVCDG